MRRSVGIIGAGYVGSTLGMSLAVQSIAEEIVFFDILREKARALSLDLEDGYSLYPQRVRFLSSSLTGLVNCDIIVFAFTSGQYASSRLDEFTQNKEAIEEMIPQLEEAGFQGLYLIITNPCDIITHRVAQLSKLPKNHIIGTGTELDSRRARVLLSQKLNLLEGEITAPVLGEHGDSMMIPSSLLQIKGEAMNFSQFAEFSLEEIEEAVRFRGNDIYRNKNSTQYGIASVACDMIQAIFADEQRQFLASTFIEHEFFPREISISLPVVIGGDGVEDVRVPTLSSEEEIKLLNSANVIYGYIE